MRRAASYLGAALGASRWRRGGLVVTATAWSWRGGPAGGAADSPTVADGRTAERPGHERAVYDGDLERRVRSCDGWGVFDRKEARCWLLPVFAFWARWAGVPRLGLGGANRAEF